MPNKFLGQHFLKNADAIKKIVAAIAPERGDTMLEIGPGHGELTVPLFEKCSKIGCTITVIEKDNALADALANSEIGKNMEIIKGDVLKILPALSQKIPPGKYRLTGNIPYYLTGRLLRIISELRNKPERCVLMLQKEVAERIMGRPPKMNRLAASVQFWADPKIVAGVPKRDFDPMPEVDSAIILLARKKKAAADASRYYAAVRGIFAQPRKTVLNNLAAGREKESVARALREVGIDPGCRPQDLGVEEIAAIAGVLWG